MRRGECVQSLQSKPEPEQLPARKKKFWSRCRGLSIGGGKNSRYPHLPAAEPPCYPTAAALSRLTHAGQ